MEEPEESRSRRILQALGSPGREPIRIPTIVVVAHPDDETIGCGAQLGRFPGLRIIHTTDGAPRRASPAAFAGWEAYRDARATELRQAVGLAGVPEDRLTCLGFPDQEASLHLGVIAATLSAEFSGTQLVITHAYEGGHPDHDATAFAVQAACELLRRQDRPPPTVLEMPLYRAGPTGWIVQRFGSDAAEAIEVSLTPAQQDLKEKMLAAHHSQREMLRMFDTMVERFRRVAQHDFSQLPNGGRLIYEEHDWGMTGARWLDLARAASRDLGLEARRCP